MENKIYNAIQKSIQNLLNIDDNDASFGYKKSSLDNAIKSVVSIDFLFNAFEEDKDSIFRYNTIESVVLILDNGSEISLDEYREGMNPVFLKIFNDDLSYTGNEIIIYMPENHYIFQEVGSKWQWSNEISKCIPDKNDAAADFNGWKNSNMLIKNDKYHELTALQRCLDLKVNGYIGYLPSIGQLMFILKYQKMLNYIFEKITGSSELTLDYDVYHSSTEHSANYFWGLYRGLMSDNIRKKTRCYTLPLFRKMN